MGSKNELKSTSYEIFIGALSILSVVNLGLMYLTADPQLDYVLMVMNIVLSLLLFVDFLYRLRTAPSRKRYMVNEFGWADLLASLPLEQLKVLRLFRVVRVWRLLRAVGVRTIWNTLVRDRANSALYSLLLIGLLMLQFGSLGMLRLESGAEGSNIETASDAIWYSIVTMATVGYGDRFPVTNPGRLLGAVVIIVGVGIFGTLTGYLANAFIAPSKGEPEPAASGGPPEPGAAEAASA